ncbi:MAG: MBL fold metallo-hydrolase [Planctomycetota bacterium]
MIGVRSFMTAHAHSAWRVVHCCVLSASTVWAWASVSGALLAQQDFSKVQIETIPVAGSISMLIGAGGNLGLLTGDDGAFLIDDQYAPLSDKILAAIEELTDEPVRFVVNTHWHQDHTGGNENMGETGAIIVAHENVRKRLSTEQFIKAFNSTIPPAPEGALPVITFAPPHRQLPHRAPSTNDGVPKRPCCIGCSPTISRPSSNALNLIPQVAAYPVS